MMPNKEFNRVPVPEVKVMASILPPAPASKAPGQLPKVVVIKSATKDLTTSPNAPMADPERTELLGSLTTQQQQRTSARVIKKLRLEPPVDRDKRGKSASDDLPECETPNKIDEKDLKFPTVKQRMPKALWSADEINLFFEALNDYGKDFDAITAHICAKMKKKGMPDVNLKAKTQVSHFYYRMWQKLSKHVQFGANVKKVVQELYALINYGELRKKLVSVNEKTCSRLGEMVLSGSMVVRARGRNLRVRTPMCRALRRLNQITERACGTRVCSRATVSLRARGAGAWARVQAAAHNPRAAAALPLRTRLRPFIRALQARWRGKTANKPSKIPESLEVRCDELTTTQKELEDNYQEQTRICEDAKEEDREDLEDHLNLEPDRILVQEQKQSKKMALHVGPRPGAQIHLPVVSPSEQLSSQKICFSSYLERMGQRDEDGGGKIRTSKRQRKDSATEKDKDTDPKKFKVEDADTNKLMHIDETAIDGIELMANYKSNQEDEEKPSTEDEKDLKAEETAEDDVDRDKYMSEREKDSFSEMEDDEKYNKSDTDNESDHGKSEKIRKEKKFKNLKVKFRIRPKKRGGSIYTLVVEKDQEEAKNEEPVKIDEDPKPDFDVDMALKQIRKGWSVHDAGDLTIGDLYIMFGSRSKIDLDYWWAQPTPPLPQPVQKSSKLLDWDKDRHMEKRERPDKGYSFVEDERERARESDNDIFSPKNTFSQDSNDGMSGDERKSEQLLSPEHKSVGGSLRLVNKLINRPLAEQNTQNGFGLMSDRLKRLLALVGNPYVNTSASTSIARCNCGHVCSQQRKQQVKPAVPLAPNNYLPKPQVPQYLPRTDSVFRHPTPIAPRPDIEWQKHKHKTLDLASVPRWRRGRPRLADRRVVVQRLLPLLPKLPPPSNLIPVKIVPNSPPAPPKILPKPPPTTTSDLSLFYVLSESNGQFFFHDGDRRIPISAFDNGTEHTSESIDIDEDEKGDVKQEMSNCSPKLEQESNDKSTELTPKADNADIGNFLPSESMSLSPSRLLRDAEGWLEGSVQDFSLSSFLGHLEGRHQPDLAVDSHLQSLMAESSVDYVAKFADLAAEVTDESETLSTDDLTK